MAITGGLYLFAPEINHILYRSLEDVRAVDLRDGREADQDKFRIVLSDRIRPIVTSSEERATANGYSTVAAKPR